MKIEYEVIDNFLDVPTFTEFRNVIMKSPVFSWQFNSRIEGLDSDGKQSINVDGKFDMTNIVSQNWRLSYLVHALFDQHCPQSDHFGFIMPVMLKHLDIKALIRAKINLYPYQDTLTEHGVHSDFPFKHKASIYSLNTCDGYTKLNDGTKVESVENRMLIFDGHTPHASTNTSNVNSRVNIAINYF
jgi:hypothetical protein